MDNNANYLLKLSLQSNFRKEIKEGVKLIITITLYGIRTNNID